ncbi:MAG: adenylate cyclase, partial [Anaerolineae bacterium]
LEAAALPGQILLAEAVYRQVADAVVARQLPPLEIKGKSEPAVVFELLELRQE